MADEIRVKSALENEGTVRVGRFKMIKSGNSVGGRIKKEHAQALGLLDTKETELYVNYELGLAIHKILGEDGEE